MGEGVSLRQIPKQAPRAGLTVEGVILGVADPIEREGRATRRVTVANETGLVTGKWDADHVLRMAEQGLRAGRHVRITGLNPWSPPNSTDVLLFASHHSALTVLAEDGIR